MKICIWYEITDQPWGGSNQFLRALSKELAKRGYDIIHKPQKGCDVVLINAYSTRSSATLSPNQVFELKQRGYVSSYGAFIPISLWSLLPRRGPFLFHRLDGVMESYRRIKMKADDIQFAINPLVDFTIFQSNYCRDNFAEYGIHPLRYRVIYNGTDPLMFYPTKDLPPTDSILRLVAVSWSMSIHKGFAKLAEISQIPGVEMRFIGRWPPSIDTAKVILLGTKTSSQIAEILRQSHAMVHNSENDPCSNAIIEALACGLPVLFKDSGGNRELAGDYGVVLTNNAKTDIEQLRCSYKELREKILDHRSRFLISRAADHYLDVFQQTL